MGNLDGAGEKGEASSSDKLPSLPVSPCSFLLCVVVVVGGRGLGRGVILLGGGYFVFCEPFGNPSR